MKIKILLLILFVTNLGFSQSVNDYKAVIVPLKFEFLKSDNQYRLATMSKFNLNKAGFEAYYDNEPSSYENIDRCSLLNFDVVKESSFLSTKLYIVLKDCYGKIVFQSITGVSKEKDYELAYTESLNKAFASVYALQYKYSGNSNLSTAPTAVVEKVAQKTVVAMPDVNSNVFVAKETAKSNLLYAQANATGFQLVDSTPSVVMNLYKTAIKECFIAVKGNVQGVLVAKDNQWFFEYYQNEILISEKIEVKF